MISLEQIRGARGVLNWTQRQLAKAAGLSLRTLNSIEHGQSVPRMDTLNAIQAAFEANHILFGTDHGVKLLGERLEIEKYEGPTCQEILLNDAIDQLRGRGGIYYSNCPDEDKFDAVNTKVMDKFYADCHAYGIKDFLLVEKGFTQFVGRPSHYRWTSPDVLGRLSYSIYHDTVTFIIFEPTARIVIIRCKAIADYFLAQLKANWDTAQIPPFNRYLVKDEDPSRPWTQADALALRKKVKKMGY